MLSDRLKTARESIAKSQKEMAEALGVGLKSWQVYEQSSSVPGGHVFEALVKLGFNANWLLTGDGEMWREAEADKKLREQYPLTPLVSEALGVPYEQRVAHIKQDNHPQARFHEWIDEELKGKSITEVMSLAVKIKAGLDKEMEG